MNGDYLHCNKCNATIKGAGDLNPLSKIEYERIMMQKLKFEDNELKIAENILGKNLFNYWFNDAEHGYEEPIDNYI